MIYGYGLQGSLPGCAFEAVGPSPSVLLVDGVSDVAGWVAQGLHMGQLGALPCAFAPRVFWLLCLAAGSSYGFARIFCFWDALLFPTNSARASIPALYRGASPAGGLGFPC